MGGTAFLDLNDRTARGVAVAPGSCGELVQGSIDGMDFLVTCPVNIYSRVCVTLEAHGKGRYARLEAQSEGWRAAQIEGQPRACAGAGHGAGAQAGVACLTKTHQAVSLTIAQLGLAGCVIPRIRVTSSLPHGKGMGSSTADISAAVAATCAAAEATVAPEQIARIALSIEPTDGTMFDGIVQFDHRRGRISRPLGSPPPVDVLILDPGGEVDTMVFNANPRLPELNRRKEREVAEALSLVEEGLRNRDPWAIGRGCTLSALTHQSILPKPGLDEALRVAGNAGAAGVNVAHSGTVMAMLFDPRTVDLEDVEAYVRGRLTWAQIWRARLVGGGVEVWGANAQGDRGGERLW